jgi:exonuclease SbcD
MSAPKFSFIHAADLHLDTPFAAIGRAAPEIAERLRDASLEAFDRLVALAIERQAAFVVFAGDIYDNSERGVRAQLRFMRGIEQMGSYGILVFVAHGNHDPLGGWSAVRRLPDNLVVFGSEAMEERTVGPENEPLAHIYGISYGKRDVTENLALRFKRNEFPGLHVGVLHCNVGGQQEYQAYSPCTIEDLTQAGMDYWALGHIHQYQRLSEGQPWIVYPGSLQAVKSNELGPRGAVVVEVTGEAIEKVEFVALDSVRFARAEVDITGEPDIHALQRTILLSQGVNDGTDTLLSVTLTGRGPLHHDLRRPGALDDLRRDLREELGTARPFIWIDRIADQSRAELDREVIATRGDFSAELTRLVDRLRVDPEALSKVVAELARRGDRPEPYDAESLLREAEDRALDLLESGGLQ